MTKKLNKNIYFFSWETKVMTKKLNKNIYFFSWETKVMTNNIIILFIL